MDMDAYGAADGAEDGKAAAARGDRPGGASVAADYRGGKLRGTTGGFGLPEVRYNVGGNKVENADVDDELKSEDVMRKEAEAAALGQDRNKGKKFMIKKGESTKQQLRKKRKFRLSAAKSKSKVIMRKRSAAKWGARII